MKDQLIPFAKADDGTQLHGILRTPGKGRYPGILGVHGGGFTGGGPGIINVFGDDLTRAGFTVFSPEYRLDPPHKLEGQKSDGTYPDQTNDVDLAIRWLLKHPNCDGSVQILGGSAGAYEAAWFSARGIIPSVCCSPVTHLEPDGRSHFNVLCKAYAPGFYEEASPVTHVGPTSKPTLTYAYKTDSLPPDQFDGWQAAHKKFNVKGCTFVLLDGKGHSFEMWPLMNDEAIAFFTKNA